VRSAVEDSDNLTIPLDGHPSYGAFGAQFEVFDSHFGGKFTAACRESFLQLGVKVIKYAHAGALPSVSLCRLKP
jgi:hypothetical protein